MKDTWTKYSLLESSDLIKKFYKERHGGEVNSGKTKEIISNFVQGREYFKAAEKSPEIVRPLLQYYGVIALSRGLILFLNPSARETSLKPSHGLKLIENGELSKGISRLPYVNIEVTNGTFLELYDSIKNIEKSYINVAPFPNLGMLTQQNETRPEWRIFSFKDLISRMPSLSDLYAKVFDEKCKSFKALVFILSDNLVDILINEDDGGPNPKSLKADLNLAEEYCLGIKSEHQFIGKVSHLMYRIAKPQTESLISKLPLIKNDFSNKTYLVAPFKGGFAFNKMLEYYCASYFMSMIVRYYPSIWTSLINRETGDFITPVLRQLTEEIQNNYPEMVLKELNVE